MSVISNVILKIPLGLIFLYQKLISPLMPAHCRFTPTCSEYTKQAIKHYGFKGVWLGVRRIIRCHPWNVGGHDPVP